MILKTERLAACARRLSRDAPRIALLAGDYDVASMTGTHPASLQRGHGRRLDREHRKRARRAWLSPSSAAGALIGCVGYRPIGRRPCRDGLLDRQALLGSWLCHRGSAGADPPCLRQGGFRLSHVGHFKENPASARVIAKLGFEPTGEILRDCAARGGQAQCLTYRLARAQGFRPARRELEPDLGGGGAAERVGMSARFCARDCRTTIRASSSPPRGRFCRRSGAMTRHAVPRSSQGLCPLRRRRQRRRQLPPREVHRVRRPRRRRRRQRRRRHRSNAWPTSIRCSTIATSSTSRRRRAATAWARTAPAPAAPTWC